MYEITDLNAVLEKVGSTTYDFDSFLQRYATFFEDSLPKLVDYWKGNTKYVDPNILVEFDYIYHEYYNMIFSFQKKKNSKNIDLDYFELAEFFAEIKSNIDYIKNLPKYLKTSINFVDVFEQPVINYCVREGDTLESIARTFFGDSEQFGLIMDYNDLDYYNVNDANWVGRQIKIPATKVSIKDINGVIDGLVGLNVLGKDIDSVFGFSTVADANGNFDINTLEGEDCFERSISDIIYYIAKGTVPEYPHLGNNVAEIIGQNLGALNYSMIINSLITSVKQDPTIASIEVTNFSIVEDSVLIDFTFKSVLKTSYELKYDSRIQSS